MAIADLLGGLLGGSAGKSDMEDARGLSEEAVRGLKNVYVPTVEEQKILLQNPELVGLLQAEQYGDSRLQGVHVDPRMKEAQMKALEQMSGLAEQGLGAEDRNAIQNVLRLSGSEAQAQNAATLQNAAAQGTLDSGNTLMAQLNAGQQAASRTQQGAMQQAAQASAARREALSQKANLATQMGQNDFSQKSDIARAQDAISQFNAQNRQNVNQANLGVRQGLEGTRAANANQQEMYNKGLVQNKFNNEFAKAGGVANAQQNYANTVAGQGQAAAQGQAQMMGSLLEGGAKIGAAYAGKEKK